MVPQRAHGVAEKVHLCPTFGPGELTAFIELSPDQVADACGISKRYLHELFSDTNKTVSQFIREERLIAAREAIAFSRGKTLAEIAYRFGFTDQAQFSRLFRAMFGLTPTEWKRQRDGSAAGAGSPSVQMAAGSGGTR